MTTPMRTAAGFAAELLATAACAARYPLGVVDGALTTGRPSGHALRDTPVLLVHGYGHNHSGWWALDRHLRRAGFTSVHRCNYLPLGSGVPQLAERLAARVDEIRDLTGADRVHVVGHSLGGVLLRWYVQELGGDGHVATAVTLGSPHAGTRAAWVWPERTARQLCPGSWLVRRLQAGARPSAVRWVAITSDTDLFVRPTTAARLDAPGLRATNISVHGLGHLSLLIAPEVLRTVTTQLEAAEGAAAPIVRLPAPTTAPATAPGRPAASRALEG